MLLRFMPHGRIAVLAMLGVSSAFALGASTQKPKSKNPDQLRADYITRLQEKNVPTADDHTVGSLWTAQSPLGDFSTDYKAHHLNDTITIQVSVQTTATQSGTVDSERSFTTTSGITGLFGKRLRPQILSLLRIRLMHSRDRALQRRIPSSRPT